MDPVHHKPTLALFIALMCDRNLLKAVYGEDYSNLTPNEEAFTKYFAAWNFTNDFTVSLERMNLYRRKVKEAQDSWFTIVGAEYSGPACPTEAYLKSIVVSFTL